MQTGWMHYSIRPTYSLVHLLTYLHSWLGTLKPAMSLKRLKIKPKLVLTAFHGLSIAAKMYDLEWPLSEIQGHRFLKCCKMWSPLPLIVMQKTYVGSLSSSCIEFQTVGPAIKNARRPYVLSRQQGTMSWCRFAEQVTQSLYFSNFTLCDSFCKPTPAHRTLLSTQYTAVVRFWLLVRRSGTRCMTSSEIRRVVLAVLQSFLRQSSSVSINVTSALEGLKKLYALYK